MESIQDYIKFLPEILIKFVTAVICGGIIGFERGYHGKPIGPRTCILICFGAAVYVMLARFIHESYPTFLFDPSRIASQIVVGVGFIGAGTILQAKGGIIGLTTAATIWMVAAIGACVGIGYPLIALTISILVLITLILIGKIEHRFVDKRQAHLIDKDDYIFDETKQQD